MSFHTTIPTGLPALDPESAAHTQAVERYLVEQIEHAPWGFMLFEQWMNLALYAPGLGYYAAGNTKFGGQPVNPGTTAAAAPPQSANAAAADPGTSPGVRQTSVGDFTTAPELTPIFGQVLARQVAQILKACGSTNVLEFGAGSGALAASLIPALRELGIEPTYQIMEVSADLHARQQQRLAASGAAVTWLDSLPAHFTGCVLANE
ncbi:MAG: hypothetical protein EPN67_05155, partial [Pusillimonas sp.]